ncbi:MAG: prolyl oligopeptidase family serine peptidase [bacterium]|nr:prolyl oligopeptidase family serine peptidase [bacterium]
MKKILLVLILAAVTVLLPGQLKKLTFEQVFMRQGEKLLKPLPQILKWDGDRYYYEFKNRKLVKVDARNGTSRLIMESTRFKDVFQKGFNMMRADDKTDDFSRFLFTKKGDIFLFDTRKKETKDQLVQLTKTEGAEKNPTFSPDASKIAYTRDGNLFVYDIAAEKTTQLTNDGSSEILNGHASWVYYEEILGRGGRYRAFWWSPDNRQLVFMRFDQSEVPIFPIFRATGIYGDLEKQKYPKPGYPNPRVKIGIADTETGSAAWIPFEDEKEHYLAFPTWNKKSDAVYFQWLNRDQNYLKILRFDTAAKAITTVYQEKQKTWIDFLEDGDIKLLADGGLLIRSSQSGWYHIYYVFGNGDVRPVTTGAWTVNAIELVNGEKQQIYFTARKEDSTETDLYRVDFSGVNFKRLTVDKGSHRVKVSPGGSYFIDEYSSVEFPARMDLRNRNGKRVRQLGDRHSPVLGTYQLAKKEIFRIKTSDGYQLPASWLLPPGFDENKKYPVVFVIYGGPGAGSVRNSFAFRGYWGQHFLAQQGIIVLTVDHRGSGHFGKKGTDLMHRNFGKWEMNDYIEAVRYLRTLPFVDGQRIGITGGSYGGYVTALALTKGADYFQYGIAGSSVIDWALYDSVYTERFMDTPKDNPDGYKSANVLNYIDKYKSGSLLITHGTMDDNVHMQNTVQFIDKVLDAGKFVELMNYPGERHGFRKKRAISNKISLDFWKRKLIGK